MSLVSSSFYELVNGKLWTTSRLKKIAKVEDFEHFSELPVQHLELDCRMKTSALSVDTGRGVPALHELDYSYIYHLISHNFTDISSYSFS